MSRDAASVLAFTGERYTPECVREIRYEHLHRYAFARQLARGRRVLDAACGEGYGSALLADAAASVLGLDIADEAVAHARRRYGSRAGLRFEVADVTALDHLPAASVDLICSFETLEHVEAQERMLDGFARLLAPGGVLLVSTPDKRVYSDLAGFRNEYHVRELYRDEFAAMLAARFPACRLFGQKLLFQSVLWDATARRRAHPRAGA
jgi:2-polyprenyl-3-methyl-5-hydroxy-6-metoxy-1,4-benzoquinol methylase